ncbi:glycosyltransferase family 4 protein [Paraburkholderia phymatum]|uniref:Glycosyltransferase family 4 protein n=1 Tax=Paraburkholderia phymatum TaxID=148447 RepID=A0ACC6TUW9_9BURK
MNILFFTPVNEASAIARVSCLLTRELIASGHHITVVSTEKMTYGPARDFGAEIVSWSDESRIIHESSKAQLVIYQIGDNYNFHRGAIEWLPRLQGIVCLHDFYVANLFNAWGSEHPDEAKALLRYWYGEAIATSFFEMARRSDFIEQTADKAPLTEWIASYALAVVSHSHWGMPRVKASCAGPVKVVPLPYNTTVDVQPAGYERHENHLALLTVGHINANKRVASVIRAIGSSPSLRRKVTYRLVGPISPDAVLELSDLANALRVKLLISGAVDDETLAQAFAESDVVSCLRWPSLEAASASAIEAMLWGKPIVVTDTGFYKDIPDNLVAKIPPSNEIAEIRAALERFDKSPSERSMMGERARQWATETYSSKNYAQSLVDLAGSLHEDRPIAVARAYFRKVLADWGSNPDRHWCDHSLGMPTYTG